MTAFSKLDPFENASAVSIAVPWRENYDFLHAPRKGAERELPVKLWN